MPILESIGSILAAFFSSLLSLFLDWLFIFVAPIKDFNALWILIPIWISWFFGEFFQEKKGTNLGNAIANGVIPFWVSLDWARLLINKLLSGGLVFDKIVFFKFAICAALFIYGITIITLGIRGNEIAKMLGRIREITYVMVMFTPLIYGIIEFSWGYFVGIVIFFPLFYLLIEWIDMKLPDPKAFEMDSSGNR